MIDTNRQLYVLYMIRVPRRKENYHKAPHGQTIVHIENPLLLAYNLNRKVNEKVGELSDVEGIG